MDAYYGPPLRGPCIVHWQEILSPSYFLWNAPWRNWNRASGPGTASGLLLTRIRRLRYRCCQSRQSASRSQNRCQSRHPKESASRPK